MSTPIKLYELTIRNFKSFGNNLTKLKLDGNSVTLIIGRNLDASINGQIDSNGSGKTTILDAISYCFYDKTISKIAKDDLINNVNKKNMEVSVVFEKDNMFYRIIRYRKHKAFGGNGVAIYRGNSLDDVAYESLRKENDIASAGTADAQIVSLINIPYDIFSRIIIFSATHEPFLTLPASSTANKANQRDIIEELLGLTELSEKAEKIKKELTEDNKELSTLVRVEEEIQKQKKKMEDQIESAKKRISDWETNHQSTIRSLTKKIDDLSGINYDQQASMITLVEEIESNISKLTSKYNVNQPTIRAAKEKIKSSEKWETEKTDKLRMLKSKIDSFTNIDFDNQLKLLAEKDEHTSTITSVSLEKKALERELIRYSEEYGKASDEIVHLEDNKCPYCLQQFADAKAKVSELNDLKYKNYALMEDAKKRLKSFVDSIEDIKQRIEQIDLELVFKSTDKVMAEKSARERTTNEYDSLVNTVNPYASDDLTEVKATMEALEDKNIKLMETIDELKREQSKVKSKLLYNNITQLERSRSELDRTKELLVREQALDNPYINSLNDLQSVTTDDSNKDAIEKLKYLVNHKTFLHKLLTKPESFLRKSLLSDRLSLLNKQLRYYLDILGLPHKVVFTEELDVHITQFGNELGYDRLSSGQKARVNIALSFAFRDVLQSRYGKINFCILDECLDVGLSNVGVAQAVQMIKKVASDNKLSMFVISHRDEIASSFNNILEIELSNGFSEIVK